MDHENCPDRAADRIGAAEAVRRHGRVVSYITEALVEIGHDVTLFASGDSTTRAKLEPVWPRAAARFVDPRPGRAAHAADGDSRAPREGLRRPPFPHGLLLVLGLQPAGNALRDDAARPARPARAAAGVRHVQHGAGDLDLERATPAAAAGGMADDGLPRAARYAVHAAARRAPISRSSAASRRRSASTRRSASPASAGCRSRSPRRSTRPTRNTSSARSSRSSRCRTSNSSARSPITRRPNSCRARMRCCSRSTGRSRSA